MIIKEYTICHIGPFNDKFTMNMDINQDGAAKPIILVGGRNGRGKTTLLDGIKLCLYGIFFQGKKMSERAYSEYILDCIHKPMGLTSSEGGHVSLLFEHSHLGQKTSYFIKRSWNLNPFKEKLEILENGEPVQGIPKSNLQNFLFELIPFGLSDLFFFDGEKIQNLAKDKNNEVLFNSINSLFGLDTITNLQTDLSIFVRKENKNKKHANKNLHQTLHAQLETIQARMDQLEIERSTFITSIDALKSDIQKTEQHFSEAGGTYFQNYDNIKRENERLEQELEQKEMEIREHLMSLFPFTLIPDLLNSMQKRMEDEKKYAEARNSYRYSHTIREKIIGSLRTSKTLPDDKSTRASIIKDVDSLFDEYNQEPEPIDIAFTITEPDRQKIYSWISETRRIPKEIDLKFKNIEELIGKIKSNKDFLDKSPPEEKVSPILESLKGQNLELGKMESEIAKVDQELNSTQNEKQQKINEIMKEEKLELDIESTDRKVKYAIKTMLILDSFKDKLQKNKMTEISKDFCKIYNEITDYKLNIKSIDIDDSTKEIIMKFENGTTIQKNKLSSGERQIYATAMLMALAMNTEKPLPFIIDTPLARLDAENRQSIVEKVYPYASHQVIILSTSSEIDQKYYNELLPKITRSYKIDFNTVKKESTIHPGYFWSKQEIEK